MDDYISRQAAIEAASKGCFELRGIFGQVKAEINALPSADVPHWIPCSERLPEEGGEYLVTDVSGGAATVTETYFITDCEGEGHWGALDVIAWMPLPEPYEEKNNE